MQIVGLQNLASPRTNFYQSKNINIKKFLKDSITLYNTHKNQIRPQFQREYANKTIGNLRTTKQT